MLGLGDFSILLVFILCIASAILCVVYGIINWNKGEDKATDTDEKWLGEEKDIAEKLDI